MKFVVTILFLLLSISFITEDLLSGLMTISYKSVRQDDTGKGMEETESKMEKVAKDKNDAFFDADMLFAGSAISMQRQQLYFSLSAGYLQQPYTPPDLV